MNAQNKDEKRTIEPRSICQTDALMYNKPTFIREVAKRSQHAGAAT